MGFKGKSIIDVHSLTRDEIEYILEKAAQIKQALQEKDQEQYSLAREKGLLAALLFYEDSTRTRGSFEVAAKRLGLDLTGFKSTAGTSVKKGESLRHTLDMFDAYGTDIVIMRHPLDGAARFAADHLEKPVFNAGDGKHEHPTQTLLDLFTIREHLGKLDGVQIGMGGDLKYGRTVHSLAIALTKFTDVKLHLFSHESLRMPASIISYLREKGMEVIEHESLNDALEKADIFYQTRIQKERMPDEDEYHKAKDACRISLASLKGTKDHFGLMHPLPINKEHPSISPDVDSHKKAIYKRQAGNGVPTRLVEMALSLGLMGDDFAGTHFEEPELRQSFYRELEVVKKPQKTDQNLKPIQDKGTVIDHLQPGTAQKLMYLLKVEERGDIYRGGTVRRQSSPDKLKAMLMIESRELSENELRVVAALSPGCRVNWIQNGEVIRKIELDMPDAIEGIWYLQCTNHNCISRMEHNEHVPPKFLRAKGRFLKCHYCDNIMQGKELF